MAIQTSAQSLLVKVMSNQTDAAAEDEKTVENAHAQVILSLLRRKGTAVAQKVDKADGDTTINVENEVVFLGGGDRLDSNRIVEELVRSEILGDKFLDEFDAQIGVRT